MILNNIFYTFDFISYSKHIDLYLDKKNDKSFFFNQNTIFV